MLRYSAIRQCYGISTQSALFTPSSELGQFRDLVRSFVQREVEPQANEFNTREQMNLPILRRLGGELGLFGISVSEEYGGSGLGSVATVIAMEELSYSDPALCLSYLAHSLLFVNNLFHNGSHEQKLKWLPATLSGERIGGMCMSEPGAGTDVLGMTTSAKGSSSGGFILNGQKMWVTNGCLDDTTLGDVFLVYAKSDSGLSLFLVEKGMDGFSLGQRLKGKCGMRASNTAELVLENVHVPGSHLVGEEGKGTRPMMKNLEIERIALAAMSLGIAKRSLDVMVRHATERKAFGEPLSRFGQIQRHIAESYAEYMAARAYVYAVANEPYGGNRLDSDGVKLITTTMAKNVADRAIQVLGGYGYLNEYTVERLWRDAKLLEIGGGTIEAHQKNITNDLVRRI
jgi:isovaleryl-CoA dehydrogenase